MESLLEKFIIWRYSAVALKWGDWESYAYKAEAHEANPYVEAKRFWENIYSYLGYADVPNKVWIDAGGYGQPYKQYLRQLPLVRIP